MTSRLDRHAPATFGLAGLLLLAGCSDGQRRDATEDEVRSAARECGAAVARLDHTEDSKRAYNRQIGIPNISVTLDFRTEAEFIAKANCIDGNLAARGVYSNIGGPNGEDLLVSSGVDRLQ
jgi:hypothetical protein